MSSASNKSSPGGEPHPSEAATAYVPRVLLEAIAVDPHRASPWHESVDGTLVMADVPGFTAMSERLAAAGREGAEWLTDIINAYFGSMLDIARGLGGTTLTFGRDAMLLFFEGEGHTARAVAAGLGMQRATRELKAFRVGTCRIKLTAFGSFG